MRGLLGAHGADTFGDVRVRGFLSLWGKGKKDLRLFEAVRGDIDESRIFCLVGSNYKSFLAIFATKSRSSR